MQSGWLTFLLLVTAGGWRGVQSAPFRSPAGSRPGFDSAEHVVIIGTDGLGR